jgi:hypothetical protein
MNKNFVSAAFAIALLAFSAHSQRITGSLGGTVHDPTGAVVPGATVQIENTGTTATLQLMTDEAGRFMAPSLTPGEYQVTIDAKGFKRAERKGLTLDVDQTINLDLALEVGESTESVVVTAEPPLVESQSSDMGQIVSARSIDNLPLNQRNPFSLIMLTPGVTGSVGSTFTGLQFNVNGGRSGTTDVLLDGIPSAPPTDDYKSLSIFPSVDAVAEFKVQTSNFSAEFGLTGGGVINVIYKSGANDVHGSAYDFLRNSDLDANSFFSNRSGVALPSFKRNQFGFSLGGPVYLPKLYNGRKYKTFFFTDYEGLRQGTASTTLTTVPTAAERTGNFSADTTSAGKPITIYDPTNYTVSNGTYTRVAFPGNIIPTNRFDAVAKNVEQYYPLPDITGTNGTQINNYYAAGTAPYNIDQYDLKFDQILSDKQRFSIRWSIRNPTSIPATLFPSNIAIAQNAATNKQDALGGAVDYVYSASPTDVLEFRYGISRIVYGVSTRADGFNPTQLGFPSYLAAQANALTFPGFEVSGYIGVGDGSQLSLGGLGMMSQIWALSNTKVFSRHTLKFGVETRLLANDVDQMGRSTGDFSFAATLTQGPNALTASSTAGDPFASFLLGLGSGTVTHNFKIVDTISHYWAGYVQDDWKATDRLTLNLGLRYDLFLPRTERHNRETYLDFTDPSPLAGPAGLPNLKGGLAYVGVNGAPRSQNPTYCTNFAPRVGFAYQLSKKLVVRVGAGLFYTDSPAEAAATINPTGWRTDSSYVGTADGVTPYNYLSNPFPGGSFLPVSGNSLGLLTSVGTSIAAPQRWSPTPYSENWDFDVQYELPGEWMVDAAYVASHGVDLTTTGQDNQLPASYMSMGSQLLTTVPNTFYGLITTSGSLSGQTVQLRYLLAPFPQFTGVQVVNAQGATSLYNSLQLRLQKRFSQGLTLLVSYTASKMMDDASSNNTSNFNGTGTNQDAYNWRGDWSLSTADVSQRFVTSFVYSLPFGRGRRFGAHWNGFVDGVLGGWQTNGILTAQTGAPVALSASSVCQIFCSGERPNSNGQNAALSSSVVNRLNEYFNVADFSQPAAYTFGDVSRTLPNIRNPGLVNLDFSLFKSFRLTEKVRLEFRAETFNAFNSVQFGGPNGSVSSSSFGVITSQANTPRQNQLALKVLF